MRSHQVYYDPVVGLRVLDTEDFSDEEVKAIEQTVDSKLRKIVPDYDEGEDGIVAYALISEPRMFRLGYKKISVSLMPYG